MLSPFFYFLFFFQSAVIYVKSKLEHLQCLLLNNWLSFAFFVFLLQACVSRPGYFYYLLYFKQSYHVLSFFFFIGNNSDYMRASNNNSIYLLFNAAGGIRWCDKMQVALIFPFSLLVFLLLCRRSLPTLFVVVVVVLPSHR